MCRNINILLPSDSWHKETKRRCWPEKLLHSNLSSVLETENKFGNIAPCIKFLNEFPFPSYSGYCMYHLLSFCSQNLCLFLVIIKMNSDVLPVRHEPTAFVIETQFVFCEIGTEFLSIIIMNFRLHRVALIML
jgi:hypothetical protein